MTLGTAVSDARQMTVFSCHDPAGNPVGHDGWSNERTADTNMTAADSCGAGGQGALSLELGANVAGYGNLARTQWVFSAPVWASISSYRIRVADSYAIPGTGAGMGQAFIGASDEGDPIYDYRSLGAGSLGEAIVSRTPPTAVGAITINASCDGQYGPCPAGVRTSRIDIPASEMILNDATTPTVTGLAGPLVSGASIHGTVDVSFTATDSGPGVYSAWLVLDGQTQPAVVLNPNSGWCENLGQTASGMRSFAHPDPCPQSTSGTLSLDTTSLPDGQHTVKLFVDDASGNATTAYNATVVTDNGPAGSTAPAILALIGSGARNGAGASESGQLRLNARHAIARSFAHRAFKLTGRLVDSQGHPIANATLDVLQRVVGTSGAQVIAHVRTLADGSFATNVAAGPSRLIDVAYRAFSGDPSYAAKATIQESVGAGVQLNISPRRTSSTGIITLSGRVLGPLPRQGVVVELLVHYLGHWEPFRTPRTDSRGHFSVSYQFQGSVGRYPFRAEVFGGQSGFPYARGASGAVDVATR